MGGLPFVSPRRIARPLVPCLAPPGGSASTWPGDALRRAHGSSQGCAGLNVSCVAEMGGKAPKFEAQWPKVGRKLAVSPFVVLLSGRQVASKEPKNPGRQAQILLTRLPPAAANPRRIKGKVTRTGPETRPQTQGPLIRSSTTTNKD